MTINLTHLKQQCTEDILGVKIINADKLAELIIRECAAWIDANVGMITDEALADLLKHFGIEE